MNLVVMAKDQGKLKFEGVSTHSKDQVVVYSSTPGKYLRNEYFLV